MARRRAASRSLCSWRPPGRDTVFSRGYTGPIGMWWHKSDRDVVALGPLSVIRIPLSPESPLAVPNTKIVKSTSRFHSRIRDSVFGVPQDIFHNPGAFHAGEGMLDTDSDACELPVRSLLSGCEFPSGWLFFSRAAKFP